MFNEGMSKPQNMCFNPLLLEEEKKRILYATSTCNRHLKGKSCKITVDPAQKIQTFKNTNIWLGILALDDCGVFVCTDLHTYILTTGFCREVPCKVYKTSFLFN